MVISTGYKRLPRGVYEQTAVTSAYAQEIQTRHATRAKAYGPLPRPSHAETGKRPVLKLFSRENRTIGADPLPSRHQTPVDKLHPPRPKTLPLYAPRLIIQAGNPKNVLPPRRRPKAGEYESSPQPKKIWCGICKEQKLPQGKYRYRKKIKKIKKKIEAGNYPEKDMLQRWIERSNTVQKKMSKKDMKSALFCYYPNKDRHAEANYKVSIQSFMHYEFYIKTPLQEIVCASNVPMPRKPAISPR